MLQPALLDRRSARCELRTAGAGGFVRDAMKSVCCGGAPDASRGSSSRRVRASLSKFAGNVADPMHRNIHLHFSGFSESRALAELGAARALGCIDFQPQAGDFCKGDSRWRSQRNASFLAHPSAQGGWHDHLNSFASSLAAANGIPVIDVKPITLRANVTQKEGAKAGIAAHDYYHGYDFPALWRLTAARVRRECGLVLRSTAPL